MSFLRMAMVAAAATCVAAPAQALLVETGVVAGPVETVDFDAMPAGTTTLAAITAAFPAAGITSIGFEGVAVDPLVYNAQTNGGRALAAGDAAGGLVLLDIGDGSPVSPDAFLVGFDRTVTEFGFDAGDFSGGTWTLETYLNGGLSESVSFNLNGSGVLNVFSSDVPFNAVRVVESAPSANWVVPTFVVSSRAARPETEVPLPGAAGLLVGAMAVFAGLRRRR